MRIKFVLFVVTFCLLNLTFGQERAIISINPYEGLITETKDAKTFNLKYPIEIENIQFVKQNGGNHIYKTDQNWILSDIDLRDTSIIEFEAVYELIYFPISLFDSIIDQSHNRIIVNSKNNYFIINNQGDFTKIQTEQMPYLLTHSYVYKTGKDNDYKFVVKDINNHSTITEFEADSIHFLPTDWINYLVVSKKNKLSLIDFRDFTTVFDSIESYKKLDFNTFIANNQNLVVFEHPEYGLLRYGIKNTTNFKLTGRFWAAEYIKSGVSFDFENGSAILTLDGQLKFWEKEISDSISIYQVDYDSRNKTYQIINKNTAEIYVDSIYDFQLINNINQSLIFRKYEELYDYKDSSIRVPTIYQIFSFNGNCYMDSFFEEFLIPNENYYWNELPLFNKESLTTVFKINKKLILDDLANNKDTKLKTLFEYIFYNIDSLRNEDRIVLLNDLIKKNPTSSELYYFRSKLNYQLNNMEEASIDIDSALLLGESFENFLRRSQFNHMQFNKTKKAKKSIINNLKKAIHLEEISAKNNYNAYDLYWIELDLMIIYKYPKKEICEYIIKIDKIIKNNPTSKNNILANEIKKLNELKVKFKINNQ